MSTERGDGLSISKTRRMSALAVALAMLCLMGCSSGAPTVYGQGVPVAPRAPAFSPALDAPITTGQPGYIGPVESAPRGTDRRVLPPTREPGIWASDKPTRGSSRISDVMLPPQEVPDAQIHRGCAEAIDRFLSEPAKQALFDRIKNTSTRRCLAVTFYKECVAEVEKEDLRIVNENRRRYKEHPLPYRESPEKRDANRIAGALCQGVALGGPGTFEIEQAVSTAIRNEIRSGQ